MLSRDQLANLVDLIFKQQFLADDLNLLNRTKHESIAIPGTKLVYLRIKNAILDGTPFLLGEQQDLFIKHLATRFKVPQEVFDAKLATFGDQLPFIDAQMRIMTIIGVIREYYQDICYKQAIEEARKAIGSMALDIPPPTNEQVNRIASERFGPDFSLLVNLHVLALLGQAAGAPLKYEDAWYQLVDRLSADILTVLFDEAA
jgi:hypothetical protein